MKKKTTFYMNEELEKKLAHWLYKYLELSGKRMTKTQVLNMLLHALLETDSIEQDIKEMQ